VRRERETTGSGVAGISIRWWTKWPGQESNEVARASEGRARVSSDEAEVRICESALSRAEEKRSAAVGYLRARQSVCEPQETAAGNGVGLLAWGFTGRNAGAVERFQMPDSGQQRRVFLSNKIWKPLARRTLAPLS
jgi:hypothetical protein